MAKTGIFLITAILLLSPITLGLCEENAKKDVLTPEEKKEIKGYTINLKQLLQRVEKNMNKIKKEFGEQEKQGRNVGRELMIRGYVERGDELYREGKLEDAQAEWEKALEISEDPEMREYIRRSVQYADEERKRLKKEEEERLERLKGRERTAQEEEVNRLDQIRAQVYKEERAQELKLAEEREAPVTAPQKELEPQRQRARDSVGRFPSKRDTLLLTIILFLLVFWLILRIICVRPKLTPKAIGNVSKETKTIDSFEPRELKKFLKKQYKDEDKDLFK